MQIGIIGAGAAGLAVGRRILKDMPGTEFVIFEQTDSVGGTWVYTDEVYEDKNGLPIHSSMYKSLRTNLPKETMEFLGFPYDEKHKGVSYLRAPDILEYLKQYAERFELNEHIKMEHHVTSIKPLPNDRWQILVKDLPLALEKRFEFDAVFVCNGHLHRPNYITIEGQDVFKGLQLHSHHYREPQPYVDKTILVIGTGPSGMDISVELASVAKHVYLSHHDPGITQTALPDNISKKPGVVRLNENSVEFIDGSICFIDVVICCTGYKINMPFITPECGLDITDFSVSPLFLHIVNINFPSMFFVGLVNHTFLFPLFEMQAQFCLKALNDSICLPTNEEMLKWWEAEETEVRQKRKKPHFLDQEMKKYHSFIQEYANTDMYDPVVPKIYEDSHLRKKCNFLKYRHDVYTVIDGENFSRFNTDD